MSRIETEFDCGFLGLRRFRITWCAWSDSSPSYSKVEMFDKDGWYEIDGWLDDAAVIDAIVSYESEP